VKASQTAIQTARRSNPRLARRLIMTIDRKFEITATNPGLKIFISSECAK